MICTRNTRDNRGRQSLSLVTDPGHPVGDCEDPVKAHEDIGRRQHRHRFHGCLAKQRSDSARCVTHLESK
jgi:hypothetical protein